MFFNYRITSLTADVRQKKETLETYRLNIQTIEKSKISNLNKKQALTSNLSQVCIFISFIILIINKPFYILAVEYFDI